MFRKPLKVKTYFQLKSSEKKKFQRSIMRIYGLSDVEILSLFPVKEPITCHRVVNPSNDLYTIYGCQGKPLFFEIEASLCPTIFTLWRCPNIIPSLPMYENLIEKLAKGAHLMIPGVTLHLVGRNRKEIEKKTIVALCTLENISAVAIGLTLVSTNEMLPGIKGKAAHIYHIIDDQLCKLFGVTESVPELGPFHPEDFLKTIIKDCEKKDVTTQVEITKDCEKKDVTTQVDALQVETPQVETPQVETPQVETPQVETPQVETHQVETHQVETPELETSVVEKPEVETPVVERPEVETPEALGLNIGALTLKDTDKISHLILSEKAKKLPVKKIPDFVPETIIVETENKNQTIDEIIQGMTMDDLVMFSFLTALKTTASEITLPVLTNIFFKNHMIPAAPKNTYIDIKKSRYKKLSNFLSEVAEDGLISLQTDKGVQTITSIDYSHDVLKRFRIEEVESLIINRPQQKKFEIKENYVVNGRVAALFSKFDYRKGAVISDQELRKCVTSYVKSENLMDPDNEEYIILNDVLNSLLETKQFCLSWKDLFKNISNKMSYSYSVKTPNNVTIMGSGKLPPIRLSTVTKASNKKVTLVDNLEVYGINIGEFSKQCQHGVAASSTTNTLPHSKSVQFQIQGNQKNFIIQLLTESYGLPRRCIVECDCHKKKKL